MAIYVHVTLEPGQTASDYIIEHEDEFLDVYRGPPLVANGSSQQTVELICPSPGCPWVSRYLIDALPETDITCPNHPADYLLKWSQA